MALRCPEAEANRDYHSVLRLSATIIIERNVVLNLESCCLAEPAVSWGCGAGGAH